MVYFLVEKWNYSWMSSTMEFLGFIDEFDLVDNG